MGDFITCDELIEYKKAKPQSFPTGHSVAFAIEVAAEFSDGQCDVADGFDRAFGKSGAKDFEFDLRQPGLAGWRLLIDSRLLAQCQYASSDYAEQRGRRHETLGLFELQALGRGQQLGAIIEGLDQVQARNL